MRSMSSTTVVRGKSSAAMKGECRTGALACPTQKYSGENDLGDLGEPEVLIHARALLAAEEVDLVAKATVVEVDRELLPRLHLQIRLHDRADRAARRKIDRLRGSGDAANVVLVGGD